MVVVIDDVHLLRSPASRQVLDALVRSVAPNSRLIIIARGDTDLTLARRRLQGDVLELGSVDLAMDETAVRVVLERIAGHVDDATARDVHRRTEGWPAAVAAAGMSLRAGAPGRPVPPISGRQRSIADFFVEEVLSDLDDETLAFLWGTALFPRFSADMTDAVFDRTDSRRVLWDLEHQNMFVVPLDDERTWYRHHPLFRDLLDDHRRRLAPDLDVRGFYERAARWHRAYGSPADAVRCSVLSEDARQLGEIALDVHDRYTAAGRLETMRLWFDSWTDDAIATDPLCSLMAASIFGRSGEHHRAERLLLAAAAFDLDAPGPAGAASLETFMCLVRSLCGTTGVDQMLRDGRRLLELEQRTGSRWLIGAHRAIGSAHLLLGNPGAAIASLERCVAECEAFPNLTATRVWCLGLLVNAHLDVGDRPTAERRLDETTAEINAVWWTRSIEALPAHVAAATIAARTGDDDLALATLAEVIEVLPLVPARNGADLALRAADAASVIGAARQHDRLIDIARRNLELLPDAGSMPHRLANLTVGSTSIHLLATLTPAEQRVLNYLGTHRTLAEIASALYVSRSTVKTHVAAIYTKLGVSKRSEAVALLGTASPVREVALR